MKREALNELALFAGVGGGILGGHLLGWRTICAIENDQYARDVLVARQNDGCLPPFPIWDDVCTFDGRPWRGRVDVVSGGFPCQDISAAGKGVGITGPRSGLWSEMARIIGEVRPRFVFVENSPMLVHRGLAMVLGDLARLGYDARWGVLGAADVGAPHRRDRLWIVGHTNSNREPNGAINEEMAVLPDVANAGGGRCAQQEGREMEQPGRAETVSAGSIADTYRVLSNSRWTKPKRQQRQTRVTDGSQDVANSASKGFSHGDGGTIQRQKTEQRSQRCGWWTTEPDVGRVANGVANRFHINGADEERIF